MKESANAVLQELMLDFLKEYCPIKRVRNKNNKWTKSLIIDGSFIMSRTQYYPYETTDIVVMMTGLYNALANVFAFNHESIVITVSKYLEVDS